MTEELTKKAAEMLLQGATLLSEPCPYCAGVRVMKEGQALCISCGKQPEKKEIPVENLNVNFIHGIRGYLNQKIHKTGSSFQGEPFFLCLGGCSKC